MTNNILQMQRNITADQYFTSVGTWTTSYNGVRATQAHTPAAETTFVAIPLRLERPENQYGHRLKSLEFVFIATTTAMTAAPVATLYRTQVDTVFNGAATNQTQTAILNPAVSTFTDGTGLTIKATQQGITVQLPNTWENEAGAISRWNYVLQIAFACAAGTVLNVYDSTLHYDTQFG